MNIVVVRKQSLWGYHFGKQRNFLKITLALPSLVATSRRLLENGEVTIGTHHTPCMLDSVC